MYYCTHFRAANGISVDSKSAELDLITVTVKEWSTHFKVGMYMYVHKRGREGGREGGGREGGREGRNMKAAALLKGEDSIHHFNHYTVTITVKVYV